MADLIAMLGAAAGAAAGGGEVDPYFNQTTLLLHGDGTNGAQNNTFLDSSTNNFTITRNGNTTQGTFSPFSADEGKWSNYFDGSGDYLTTPDSADFTLGSNNFCLEAWVYAITAPNYAQVCGQFGPGGVSNSDRGYWIRFDDTGKIQGIVTTDGTTATTTTAGTALSLNAWHHIAFVRNSNDLYLYIDGVQAGTTAFASSVHDSSLTFSIGGANNGAEVWNGYISNVRLVNGSPVYTGAFTPSATPLTSITNTKLLTCQGNRFYDANTATTAKAITVNGNPSVQPFSPFQPSSAYSTSVNGGSGYFDGSGDYLTGPSASGGDFSTGDFTVSFWFYKTVSGNTGSVAYADSGGWNGWQVNLDSAGTVTWQFLTASAGTATITGGSYRLNEWNYVTVTRSSGTITLYVNGTSAGTTTDAGSYGVAGSTVRIGTDRVTNYVTGYIAGVKLVKQADTPSATNPTSPPTATANTSFLANFTNAGIFDNTGKNNLETVGNAQVDTSVVKYGTGSMEFDGTGDYLKIPSNQNLVFGTGDFTIEFWLYFDAVNNSTVKFIYDFRNASATSASILAQESTNTWTYFDGAGSNLSTGWTSGTFTTGTWYHIAICRSSGTTKFFVDGTSTSSVADTSNYANGTFILASRYNGQDYLDGYIDDLRITKGVARYTAAFTPPTKAFPDL